LTYSLVPDVQVVPADVIVELLGLRRVDERNGSRAVVAPQKDIQKHAATHGIRDIGMCRAVREVEELDCASTLPLKLRTLALRLDVVGTGGAFDRRFHLARHVIVLALFVGIGTGRPCRAFGIPAWGAVV
jgi:hypothetical protein